MYNRQSHVRIYCPSNIMAVGKAVITHFVIPERQSEKVIIENIPRLEQDKLLLVRDKRGRMNLRTSLVIVKYNLKKYIHGWDMSYVDELDLCTVRSIRNMTLGDNTA